MLDGPRVVYDLVADAPSPFRAYSSEEPMDDVRRARAIEGRAD